MLNGHKYTLGSEMLQWGGNTLESQENQRDVLFKGSYSEFVPLTFVQGQSQSGGHGPGGGKKDDKVSKAGVAVMWVNCGKRHRSQLGGLMDLKMQNKWSCSYLTSLAYR